jgi:diaminohydroxyphosphoribosylaminopyrimidine deaminase/5-amino-6-(5-phosphoribosylamino)uracil reductase
MTSMGTSTATAREIEALRHALVLASSPDVPLGPNPRVGCVLLAPDGSVVAEGFHRGAGTAHAEADALARAGAAARGTTAVVTLEPCAHTGRTGPCAQALVAAGIARVVFAQSDPNPIAAGGADLLRAAGIEVVGGVLSPESLALNEFWTHAVTHGRPFVTWKAASTLDGRTAAADGTSRWITSPEARADVHVLRAEVGAIVVGTGTVLADDPHLAARRDGAPTSGPQPLRVVVGERDIPPGARVLDDAAPTLHLRTHDPHEVLSVLHDLEVRHALLEGGATLAAAFVRAGLVDAVRWYVAPALLGSGPAALGDAGMSTIADALRLRIIDVARVGADIRIDARVLRAPQED